MNKNSRDCLETVKHIDAEKVLMNRIPHKKSGGGANWIQSAIKNPGSLRSELHIPEGKKISAKKLDKALHSDNPTMRKQASLAKTLKSFHSRKRG